MLDPLDAGGGAGNAGPGLASCITLRIARAEEQTSIMMQRFTAYVIEVSDFGRPSEVTHRYGDFETLYKGLLVECPGLMLPPMPPKGVDGTDAAVVATRKVELEKMLKAMLGNADVLMEKQLSFWKFLNLPNPAVIAGRFVAVPRSRMSSLKTLAKLNDPKYKDETYRLAHPPLAELLAEGLRELRKASEGSHWSQQPGGRSSVCQLVAAAMGSSDAGRGRFLDMDVLALLLGLVEREEAALDDARTALNVVVAREAERFPALFQVILARGSLAQLATLAQRPKCQEFVAKLLWLAWDAPVRSAFAQPGGQGMRVLQALLRSAAPMCSLLGAVLLAGLIANGDFNAEPAHRSEALKMVYGVLDRPEAAADPQFTKTLCGANSSIVRIAGMLDDADLAPLVLNLLCTAKPPPAKLTRIAGNLASLVSDRGGRVGEETRARAAELLLHIQGSGIAPPSASAGASASPGAGAGAAADLERCEGITAHEEALESALRTQLQDGVVKSQETLQKQGEGVQEVLTLSRHRLKLLPQLNFDAFHKSFSSFQTSREGLEKVVRESSGLHRDMERQLQELRSARASSVDPQSYKDRLLAAERTYAQVKSQREELAVAQADASEKQERAESSNSRLRQAVEEVKRLDDEISSLRLQRGERETKATTLRHRANTPGLEQMKEQAKASIERNLQQARELQTIGQRVQQGDPDYLKPGESREAKISEVAAKLSSLKQQQQQLLQQQKDLDFDPVQLGEQASRLESEAREFATRADALEIRRLDLERDRASQMSRSSQLSEEARAAHDRKSSLQTRLAGLEQDARLQMSTLQPMIQEHHAGWQRLLAQQKKLESDQHTLSSRLEESGRAAEMEAHTRKELHAHIRELILTLQGLGSYLDQVGGEPSASDDAFTMPAVAPSTPAAGLFAEEHGPPLLVDAPPPLERVAAPSVDAHAPAAAPAAAAGATASLADDFDEFLREEPTVNFGTGAAANAPPALDEFAEEQ